MSEDEAWQVAQYLKTFSPVWREREAGRPIEITPDPWRGGTASSLARGRVVYHVVARCWSCHPSYASGDAIARMAGGEGIRLRDDADRPLATPSAFGRDLLAPDLRGLTLRGGSTPADLYRTIGAGLGGTGMPTWKGALEERDLWALVHYVGYLGRSGAE